MAVAVAVAVVEAEAVGVRHHGGHGCGRDGREAGGRVDGADGGRLHLVRRPVVGRQCAAEDGCGRGQDGDLVREDQLAVGMAVDGG